MRRRQYEGGRRLNEYQKSHGGLMDGLRWGGGGLMDEGGVVRCL